MKISLLLTTFCQVHKMQKGHVVDFFQSDRNACNKQMSLLQNIAREKTTQTSTYHQQTERE